MKALYPVKIYYDLNDNVYYADFIDLGEDGKYFTYGADIYEAYEMAEDAINLELFNYEKYHQGKKPPEPSSINKITREPDSILTLIKVDTEKYSRKLSRLWRAE